jgi:hypothetical protein
MSSADRLEGSSQRAARQRMGPLPWTLRAAIAVVSVEALAECVAVAGRDELTPGFRAALALCVTLKVLFAWRVGHRSPGAALGLLMLEGTTIVAAFGAVEASGAVRLALGATAASVMVLLLSSLHTFPAPDLPKG